MHPTCYEQTHLPSVCGYDHLAGSEPRCPSCPLNQLFARSRATRATRISVLTGQPIDASQA
jgi:hypothetical protein